VQDLEQKNTLLERQKEVVVKYNKEIGSFETTHKPIELSHTDITDVRELLNKIKERLNAESRLTLDVVLRSLDKYQHGDLSQDQLNQGFERMGIQMKKFEISLLAKYLDRNNRDHLKIDPLIREVYYDIRCEEFYIPQMLKLAAFIDSEDFTRQMFATKIDPRKVENLNYDSLSNALKQLKPGQFLIT
jgi:hypothetical protein